MPMLEMNVSDDTIIRVVGLCFLSLIISFVSLSPLCVINNNGSFSPITLLACCTAP